MTYFIGIDFGHAETCASYIPDDGGAPVSRILFRSTDYAESTKVISAVCKRDDRWQLVFSEEDYKSSSLREGFKAPIDILRDIPEDLEALKQFGRLIFSEIHDRIKKASNDDFEIEICIANPSGWRLENSTAPDEYLQFFRDECLQFFRDKYKCRIPATLCINESDAALYTRLRHNDKVGVNDTVLIIDLGSSTIDFTAYQNSRSIPKGCWGVPVGAHCIEDRIVTKVIRQAENSLVEADRLRRNMEVGGENGNLRAALSLYAREEKEKYYTKNRRDVFRIDIRMADLVPLTPDDPLYVQNVVNFRLEREAFDRDIAGEYKVSLDNELDSAKKRLHRLGVEPNCIILSGGASRMDFVEDCVKTAFPGARILINQEPAWVVSDGTAQFIKTFEKCVADIESLANDRNSLHSSAANLALKECMEEYLISKYLNRESDTSVRAFIDIFNDMWETSEFRKSVEQKFADKGIVKIISRYFEMIKINNPRPFIKWEEFVSVGDDFPDKIKQIATDLFVSDNSVIPLNMGKYRDEDARKRLIDGTVSRVSCERKPNYYIPTKQEIRKYLRDILDENGMSISMKQD